MLLRYSLMVSTALVAMVASQAHAQVSTSAGATPASADGNQPASPTTGTTSQTTAALEGGQGEIVVTARRRAESLSKVPISITAFSSEVLVQKGIESTFDLTKFTPGLNIAGGGTLVAPFITIRGQSRGLAGPGTPGVLTYLNDVPLPTYGSLISTFDIDSLQVLKGPQGTLFGRNAIGGALLTYSKKPTYEFGGYVRSEYSRFNTLTIEGAINIPIVEDKLAVRLAAQSFGTEGYTRTIAYTPYVLTGPFSAAPGQRVQSPRNYDEYDNRAFRASVLLEPTDYIHNITVIDSARNRGAVNAVLDKRFPGTSPVFALPPATLTMIGLGGLLNPTFHCSTSPSCDIDLAVAAAGNKRVAYTDLPPDALTKIFGVSNTTTVDIGDNTQLKNIFGYRTTSQDQNADIDGSALALIDTTNRVRLQQVTNELQLSGSALDKKLTYVIGGFYYKSSPNGRGGFQSLNINVFNGLSDNTSSNYLSEKSRALYGQVDYDLSSFVQGLGVTAGYRYTWDRQMGCVYSANYSLPAGGRPPMPGTFGFLPTEGECKSGNFTRDPNAATSSATNFATKSRKGTYTFAVNWQITPDLLLYATTRRGYRSGGFNGDKLAPSVADLQTFRPETLTDVEIGTKGRFKINDVGGTFDLAIYRGKDGDYQYYQNTTGVAILPPSGVLVNKADLIIKGFELAGTLTPVRGLTFGANAAYTKVSVSSISIAPSLAAAFAAAGQSQFLQLLSVPNQPKWQFNANIYYEVPGEIAGGRLQLNADFHYQTKYRSGEIDIEKYRVTDTRATLAGLMDGSTDLSVFVRNVFDETYQLGSAGSSSGGGIISTIYAPPRTYGASVRYRF